MFLEKSAFWRYKTIDITYFIGYNKELKKENEAHWRQLTQLMKSNPELFEQFSGADEVEQDLIDNGYLVE